MFNKEERANPPPGGSPMATIQITGWLKTPEIYYFTVLEAKSLVSISLKSKCHEPPSPATPPSHTHPPSPPRRLQNPFLAAPGSWWLAELLDLWPHHTSLCLCLWSVTLPLPLLCVWALLDFLLFPYQDRMFSIVCVSEYLPLNKHL